MVYLVDRCSEHPSVVDKVEKVQITVAEVKQCVTNMDRALIQVMEELRTRKLTPMVTWIIGVMAGIIGSMSMYIMEHLVGK